MLRSRATARRQQNVSKERLTYFNGNVIWRKEKKQHYRHVNLFFTDSQAMYVKHFLRWKIAYWHSKNPLFEVDPLWLSSRTVNIDFNCLYVINFIVIYPSNCGISNEKERKKKNGIYLSAFTK